MKKARADSDFSSLIPKVGDLVRVRRIQDGNRIFEAKVIARGNECNRFWIQVSCYQLVSIAHSITYKPIELDLNKDGWALGSCDVEVEMI